MQKNLKNRKGSVSLFVLLSALFFLVMVTAIAISLKNKESGADLQYERLKENYGKDVGNEDNVYNSSLERTVTFDANGGSVNIPSKKVKLGATYGELPTPTREGYIFRGWNGKNLASIIDENNYSIFNHAIRTTSEFINDNIKYIRIKGIESNTRIDTAWFILDEKEILLEPNIKYSLSLDVRTFNSVQNTYFSIATATGGATGFTGLYNTSTNISNSDAVSIRQKLLKSTDDSINFDNDGSWHRVNVNITVPSNVNEAKLVIGNDNPDLYGKDSYIDIANIQIEEGTQATEYEPYFVTSDTRVTQNNDDNYTLTAIWESNKATSVELSSSKTTLTGGNVPDTVKINTSITPEYAVNKKLEWTSSNNDIATVDESGLVTAGDEKGEVTITARTTDGSNISKSITLNVNKCIQYFVKDGEIKQSRIYGTPFYVFEGYGSNKTYTMATYTAGSTYTKPLNALLYGSDSEKEDIKSKVDGKKGDNVLHLHSNLIGSQNGFGLALEKVEKVKTGTVKLDYTMETGSWTANLAFGVYNTKKLTSIPTTSVATFGDGNRENLVYQRTSVQDSTIANRTSYSYNTTITNDAQPVITICAPSSGYTGVYIRNYCFEY